MVWAKGLVFIQRGEFGWRIRIVNGEIASTTGGAHLSNSQLGAHARTGAAQRVMVSVGPAARLPALCTSGWIKKQALRAVAAMGQDLEQVWIQPFGSFSNCDMKSGELKRLEF